MQFTIARIYMENNKYITVSQLNKYLKYKYNDPNLGIVFLKGEISEF